MHSSPVIEGAAREGRVTEGSEVLFANRMKEEVVDRWFDFACFPVLDQGRRIGACAIAQDVTENRSNRQAFEAFCQDTF